MNPKLVSESNIFSLFLLFLNPVTLLGTRTWGNLQFPVYSLFQYLEGTHLKHLVSCGTAVDTSSSLCRNDACKLNSPGMLFHSGDYFFTFRSTPIALQKTIFNVEINYHVDLELKAIAFTTRGSKRC